MNRTKIIWLICYVNCTISKNIFLKGRVGEKHEMKVSFVLYIKVLVKLGVLLKVRVLVYLYVRGKKQGFTHFH